MEREDYAGQTITVDMGNGPEQYDVEGYWDVITGVSWMFSDGNFAALKYAVRSAVADLPLDDAVLYGKIGGLGHLVHVSEIVQ